MPALLRSLCLCFLGFALLAASPGAIAQKVKLKQPKMLLQLQEDYSKAIRWNDFEGAWTLLDPTYREANPVTDAEFSRYEQIQVTAFEDLDSRVLPDGSVERAVRIELVNRHTQSQRTMRFTEVWRYDPKTKRWWLASGLPNFWEGR